MKSAKDGGHLDIETLSGWGARYPEKKARSNKEFFRTSNETRSLPIGELS